MILDSNNPPLAVIGASSMVGSRFCELAKSQFQIIKGNLRGSLKVDITNYNSVKLFFKNFSFEWIVLFAAFTDVDAAEKQRENKQGSCWQINVIGAENVASVCLATRRKLVFISTDFVFDGTYGPYTEEDPTGPDLSKVSWYGITKIEAEKAIQRIFNQLIILRIAYPYRARFLLKDDIAKRILRLHDQNRLYPMFTDQIITPTFVDDSSGAISLLMRGDQRGTFHLACSSPTTQFEFACYLLSVFKKNPEKLTKDSIVEFLKKPGVTPRPVKGGLKVDKIKLLGFEPTDWKDGIQKIYLQSKGRLI